MNKQILKEIKNQCYEDDRSMVYSAPYFNEEKFAELIIKEVFTVTNSIKADYLTQQLDTMDFGMKNIYAEGRVALERLESELQNLFSVEPETHNGRTNCRQFYCSL